MKRWLHQAALMVPLSLALQEPPALVERIENHPDVSLVSVVRVYTPADRTALLGNDAEAAGDFGIVGVSEFQVGMPPDDVVVRLSEMIDSAAAFGWFAHRREWTETGYEPVVLGAEGYASGDGVVFWQASYIVELRGPREGALALGGIISDAITGPSRKPTVSTLLPAAGRVPDSERYILTPAVLEERFGLDPTLLGFENDVEVAAATYRDGDRSATLALLSYPTPQLAELHSDAWLAASRTALPSRRSGLLFGIVTTGDSPELADSILSELRSQFDVTWSQSPPDPLTIQEIVLTAFTWIGIALLFTVVAGMGFGGLRIYMKTRYPSCIFGGGAHADFVQLNIDQSVTRRELPD